MWFHFHTQILLMLLPTTAHRKGKTSSEMLSFLPLSFTSEGHALSFHYSLEVGLQDWVWTSNRRFSAFLVNNCEVCVKREGY